MTPKFKVGDEVEIVGYGALIWSMKKLNLKLLYADDDGMNWYDRLPELVGEKAVVSDVTETQDRYQYELVGIDPVAWYNEDQLIHTVVTSKK